VDDEVWSYGYELGVIVNSYENQIRWQVVEGSDMSEDGGWRIVTARPT
jgi:hypothetical protein